jgi:hypothetical protein
LFPENDFALERTAGLWYAVPTMSIVTVKALRCDNCGFTWLPLGRGKKLPERCPSRKCRTRQWNVKASRKKK